MTQVAVRDQIRKLIELQSVDAKIYDNKRLLEETPSELRPALEPVMKSIEVLPVSRSRIVEVRVHGPYPTETARIANSVAENFIEMNLERRYNATSYARRFLRRYEGSHPAPLGERIAAHAYDFDIDSPLVRSVLSRRERKHLVREFLARNVSSAFRVGAGSSRIVGRELPAQGSGLLTLV